MNIPRVHVVTNDAVLAQPDFIARARAVAAALGTQGALHVRGRSTSARTVFDLCEQLAPDVRAAGAMLVVNDRIDAALALGVPAVQLGVAGLPVSAARQLLGAAASIGYSAHDAGEAAVAAGDGADWIFAGSIYETASHPGQPAAGLALLERTVAAVRVPVLAIGGVSPDRVVAVLNAGAYGVAISSGIWAAPDGGAAAQRYRACIEERRHDEDDRSHHQR